jgi:hypothetical protein
LIIRASIQKLPDFKVLGVSVASVLLARRTHDTCVAAHFLERLSSATNDLWAKMMARVVPLSSGTHRAAIPVSQGDRPAAKRSNRSRQKSRISNGSDLLPECDGRSAIARRYKDISVAILSEQGGDRCSEARIQLIRRFAAASVIAEQMEADLANGKQIDIAQHALLVSSCVRIARQIGISRVAKDITPDPLSFARSYANGDGSLPAVESEP